MDEAKNKSAGEVQPVGWPFRSETQMADERAARYVGNNLRVTFRPHESYPSTIMSIQRDDGAHLEERLLFSHHALGKVLTGFEFNSILEIGSRNGVAARAFEFVGKQTLTVELSQLFHAMHSGDYLDLVLPQKVDAIWCSHVLEHQRYLSRFLEKVHDDLNEGGVLAITVPAALSPLMLGHCNTFTGGHLLYHLILAGFDCSQASLKVYDWQLSAIVRKVSNGLPRISTAAVHEDPETNIGVEPRLPSFFPPHFRNNLTTSGHVWGEVESLNW